MTTFARAKETKLTERSNTFSDHDVRVRAHQIWVRNGRPEGHAEYDWRDALAELVAEGLAKGGPVPALFHVAKLPVHVTTTLEQDISAPNALNKGHA